MNYTPYWCITQEKIRALRTRGASTPSLKLGGCGAVLLSSQELAGCGEITSVVSVKHETPPRALAWME